MDRYARYVSSCSLAIGYVYFALPQVSITKMAEGDTAGIPDVILTYASERSVCINTSIFSPARLRTLNLETSMSVLIPMYGTEM